MKASRKSDLSSRLQIRGVGHFQGARGGALQFIKEHHPREKSSRTLVAAYLTAPISAISSSSQDFQDEEFCFRFALCRCGAGM